MAQKPVFVHCINSLYKSTYKGLAFKKGKTYQVVKEDAEYYWIIDRLGHEFDFAKTKPTPCYIFTDYFKLIP